MKINRGLRLITNPNFMHYFLGKTLKMTVDVHCLAPPSIVTPESSNSWKSNEELPGALLSADRMTEIWEAWLTVKRMENGEWHAMPGNLNVLTYVRLGGSFWPVFFMKHDFFSPLCRSHTANFQTEINHSSYHRPRKKTHGSRRNSWQRFINRTAELRNHLEKSRTYWIIRLHVCHQL